ncbi:hypothetical protein AB0I84_50090, partial [Streptomyces spectabilis]|uniref:hypothetical protein n=1 Tax=Streptomyces spectabilis TaxID=68270 RepID=UPI0033C27123
PIPARSGKYDGTTTTPDAVIPPHQPYVNSIGIKQARAVHGLRYDYTKVQYVGAFEKVTIACPEHGEFLQAPVSHVRGGRHCPTCADRSPTTEEWIERAREIHGDRYDYEQVTYVRSGDKVWITCREHGAFEQQAASHLFGSGCPTCSLSKGEQAVARVLDELGVLFDQEWSHPTCRHKKPLRFDFHLPRHRALIEFDGSQHFQPVSRSGMTAADAERAFLGVQHRDRIKTDWAKANGYQLLRVADVAAVEDEVSQFLAVLTENEH